MPKREPEDTVGKSDNFAGQLEQAFNSIGGSMMSADFAGKLLAYLYELGGGNESVTLHKGMNAGIMIAQEKFNLKGGSTPTMEGIKMIQKYVKDLQSYKEPMECPWLWEIYLRYEIGTKQLMSKNPNTK